jgi:PAS domain S-box-containing protein
MTDKHLSLQYLVDIAELQKLFECFSEATGFTTGLVDQKSGEMLIRSGWREICTSFHRINPESERLCIASNLALSKCLNETGQIRFAHCGSGLVDGCTPVIIQGCHLATLFTGQVLLEPPDVDRFRRQARQFGFDEKAYLEALEQVPVISEEKLLGMLRFLAQITAMMANSGLARLQARAAQRELGDQKALLDSLINSIPDLIFYKDCQSVYLGSNTAFEAFSGQSREQLLGHNDFDFFPYEVARQFRARDRAALAEGKPCRNEEWVTYADGRRVLLDTLKTPLIGPAGEVVGLVGISRDITRMKVVEQELADERERLLVTLRSLGEGVITTDNDGQIVLVNEAAEKLTGWGQRDAGGRSVREVLQLVDDQTGQPRGNPVLQVLAAGQPLGEDEPVILVAQDGRRRSISYSAVPLRDRQGQIVGTVLVLRDITSHIRMEQELRRIEKLESLGVLAGGIAHDFNNILTAIVGNVSLALQLVGEGHRAEPLLETAEAACWRARDLTQQLLTFAKGAEPMRKTTAIGGIIREAAGFALHGSSVACHFHLPDNLWMVDVDAGQIGQVIQNLVINARQAMPGGGCIDIECANVDDISAEGCPHLPRRDYVKIVVRDNGPGIAREHLDDIFDPFFSTRKGGSGLGLAIVHSIVRKHDGNIRVNSESGSGATFEIFLPANRTASVLQDGPAAVPGQGSGTVLVMDDEKMIRDMARLLLTHLGYDVVLAADGHEAVRMFRELREQGQPVVVTIMDLTIPGGMGGQQAVKEILSIDPAAKVIVSSGYSDDPVMAHYRDFGFRSAISKPFSLPELGRAVSEVLAETVESMR